MIFGSRIDQGSGMRFVLVVTFFSLVSSACSLGGSVREVADSVVDLDHRERVSEVAWVWESPGDYRPAIFSIPGGVAVIHNEGVVALSGDSGDEIWKYEVPNHAVVGNISDNGKYVVLQVGGEESEGDLIVLDSGVGELVYEKPLPDFSMEIVERAMEIPQLRDSLRGVTDESWIVLTESDVMAHRLRGEGNSWSVSNSEIAPCGDVTSVDSIAVLSQVVVAAFTCYEQMEGEGEKNFTEGHEFTSGFVGLEVETGEALWRSEGRVGMFPADSQSREMNAFAENILLVKYPYENTKQLLDVISGEVIEEGRRAVIWSSRDGSRVGFWDIESNDYVIEDFSEGIVESLSEYKSHVPGSVLGGGGLVGLEGGVVYLAEEVSGERGKSVVAEFVGFRQREEIVFGEGVDVKIVDGLSVPGSVVVSYVDSKGRGGIMGLI